MTNRDTRNIYTIYKRAKQKERVKTKAESTIHFPLSIIKDRRRTPLEAVVEFLRDSGMKNGQVAKALDRSRKTISTVYKRAKT